MITIVERCFQIWLFFLNGKMLAIYRNFLQRNQSNAEPVLHAKSLIQVSISTNKISCDHGRGMFYFDLRCQTAVVLP